MRLDELGCERRSCGRVDRGSVYHQHWLLESVAEARRFERATRGRAEANYQRTVRVDHVLPGALAVAGAGEFYHGVAIGDPAVLRKPSFRAPAPAGKRSVKSSIQSAAVDACLTTGNDFLEHGAFYGLLVASRYTPPETV